MKDYSLDKGFLLPDVAKACFETILSEVKWHNELKAQDGTTVTLKRYMAYVSDKPVVYNYANLSLQGQGWTDTLTEIKDLVAAKTGHTFNSVLLNHYRDGKDIINWHSDKEKQLIDKSIIAAVNLGAGRTFHFLEKATGIKSSVFVENGDLLLMHENCQENYLHAILKEKDVKDARISLTFRLVDDTLN